MKRPKDYTLGEIEIIYLQYREFEGQDIEVLEALELLTKFVEEYKNYAIKYQVTKDIAVVQRRGSENITAKVARSLDEDLLDSCVILPVAEHCCLDNECEICARVRHAG